MQPINAEDGEVTVHAIEPAGLNPVVPVTIAVKVVVPPNVGDEEALIEIVGTRFDIAIVTEFEATGT